MDGSVAVYDEYVRTEWKLLALKRVDNPAMSVADIAKSIGYNPNTVRVWLQTPTYQRYENWLISQRRDELVGLPTTYHPRFEKTTVPERFQEYQAEMQARLLDLIETTSSDKLQADLIQNWLAYCGIVPKNVAQNNAAGGPTITVDKMIIFAQRAAEVGLTLPSLASLIPPPGDGGGGPA